MAAQDTNHMSGVAALTKQLIALGKMDDGKVLRDAVRTGMKPALARAKATIPVGKKPHRLGAKFGKQLVNSGYAQSTLRVITTINDQKNIASAIMSTRSSAFYAPQFVELGTRYQSAHPWLRPAFMSSRTDMEDGIKSTLQKWIEKTAKT